MPSAALTRPEPGDGEVDELLLPPALSPDEVRPLAGGRTLELAGDTMGTSWSLTAVAGAETSAAQLGGALEGVFAQVIAQMSQWEPESELSRYNRAGAGTMLPIGREFAHVLDCALNIARASGGAFDPALGAASEAWGFGAGPPPKVPEGASGRHRPDWTTLNWKPGERKLVQPGGLVLDFSGIGKGFAVDMGIAALEALGIRHALLEIGGELRGIGVRADGLPWWVDLEQPPGAPAPTARIGLSGWAVATSGNYHRRRFANGRSWSHTLDPKTGAPLPDCIRAVSVLHRGCMQADALATAITVLGPDHGLAFAGQHGIPARIVTTEATLTSIAWQRWLN